MARTSSRVRDLAHKRRLWSPHGSWLPVAPPHCTGQECIPHPPQQRISARDYAAPLTTRLSRIHSRLGGGRIFNNAYTDITCQCRPESFALQRDYHETNDSPL